MDVEEQECTIGLQIFKSILVVFQNCMYQATYKSEQNSNIHKFGLKWWSSLIENEKNWRSDIELQMLDYIMVIFQNISYAVTND